MMTVSEGYPDDVLAVMASGRGTIEDYRDVLLPEANVRLERHDTLRLLYVIGKDFESFSPGAMVADTRFGLGHLGRLDRCALVTDVAWIADGARLFAPLFHVPFRVFSCAEADAARDWVLERADHP